MRVLGSGSRAAFPSLKSPGSHFVPTPDAGKLGSRPNDSTE